MVETIFLGTAFGSVLAGLSLVIKQGFKGFADLKRAEYEGQALLIRARRGDPPAPVIMIGRADRHSPAPTHS